MFKRTITSLDNDLRRIHLINKMKRKSSDLLWSLWVTAISSTVLVLYSLIYDSIIFLAIAWPLYFTALLIKKVIRKLSAKEKRNEKKEIDPDEYKRSRWKELSQNREIVRYSKALAEQFKNQKNNKKIVDLYPSKEDTIDQLLFDIDSYQEMYNLPKIAIGDDIIESMFEIVYDALFQKIGPAKCYDYLNRWVRHVLAKTLYYHNYVIKIDDFQKGLSNLINDPFEAMEIIILRKKILERTKELIRKEKIIELHQKKSAN